MKAQLIATIATISISTSVAAQFTPNVISQTSTHQSRIRIIDNGTKLTIDDGKSTKTITANSLNALVLDVLDCKQAKLVNSKTLSGQRFVPQAISLDKKTGNLAVGVLFQECLETQQSAVFVLQPQGGGWDSYAIYRVQVPGKRRFPNDFSTYPLRSISGLGFLNGDLLVKHGDASGTEALLVFTPSKTPAGKYVGCVVTNPGESRNICPSVQ